MPNTKSEWRSFFAENKDILKEAMETGVQEDLAQKHSKDNRGINSPKAGGLDTIKVRNVTKEEI